MIVMIMMVVIWCGDDADCNNIYVDDGCATTRADIDEDDDSDAHNSCSDNEKSQ